MASTPKRSSTRLQKGAPEPPTSNVQETKILSTAKAVEYRAGRKRTVQVDSEDDGPPAKRVTVSKSPLKSSIKPASKASKDSSKKLNTTLTDVFQQQQQTTDEESKPRAHVTSSGLLVHPEKPTLLKRAQDSRSQSPIVLPEFVDHELAAQLAKNTGRRVTFAPAPYKKPSRRMSVQSLNYLSRTNKMYSSKIANKDAETLGL